MIKIQRLFIGLAVLISLSFTAILPKFLFEPGDIDFDIPLFAFWLLNLINLIAFYQLISKRDK